MSHRQLLHLLIASLIALGISGVSSGDENAEAKRAFISGMKHFDLGEYDDALNEFKNGYRAKEDPVFLYNIAQCYRLKNEHRDAIRYYRLYLSRASDAPNRAEIEERITKLQTIVDNEDRERAAAPAPAATASQPAISVPTTPSAEVSTAAASPQRTPVYKKWWLWTVVGVVAVGAGVGLGVGLTRSATPSGTTFPSAGF